MGNFEPTELVYSSSKTYLEGLEEEDFNIMLMMYQCVLFFLQLM